MSRLDYDVVFYRVFCVTLLAVAFTFTVILTNVFVDIDGLLSNKNKYLPETTTIPETLMYDEVSPIEEPKDIISNEEKNYDTEISPSYRTKRSVEPETTYRAKSPAMKKMLTRRLASLLEELDEEEAKKEVKLEITTTKPEVTKNEKNGIQRIKHEDLLHLAMHNILLQGLIGHMDLNDVYKKVHELVQTFNKNIEGKKVKDENLKMLKSIVNSKELLKEIHIPELVKHNNNEEHKFFDELIKCKDLEEQIAKNSLSNEINATNENQNRKDDTVFIKTVIEINEKDNRPKATNKSHSRENVEGLIKLIYNGKSIKITQMHDETNSQKTKSKSKAINEIEKSSVTNKDNNINYETKNMNLNNQNRRHHSSPLLNKVLEEYLKKHSLSNYEYLQSSAEVESIKTQRLKRQIKIRYSNNVTSSKIKPVHEGDEKDDDLFIEIETHYDGKGIKGEKKKKLVRSLIDKIQKALHSDIEEKRDSIEHIKFVKRTQDPIYSQNKVPFNDEKPLEPIEHRLLDPIGKTLQYHENIADRLGDSWKKQYNGPNFLSVSKAVNSAEMNEVNVNYDRVLRNGIPKRLQSPLNTETDDESDSTGLLNPNSGNVTLFLKDIDGSGFSIGFNQYEGEPPDNDSMKMFNGIENLIREYHKTYDQDTNLNNEPPVNKVYNVEETNHEMAKRNVENLHKVYRRSIPEVGSNYYNTNILKIFFKENPSFNYYLNIFKRQNHKLKLHNRKDNVNNFLFHGKDNPLLSTNLSHKEGPIIVDERFLNKTLRSSEIFSTGDVVNRKKRSVNVKKISNLKSKIKLNRYLNTKAMAHKKVFINNKRNKRHVNNIRILARDRRQDKPSQKNSDENIFFISKENSYKETMIGSVDTADTNLNYKNTEYIDDESPFSNIYRIQNPNIQTGLTEGAYDTSVNGLMSKYPHIFLDESYNSKENIYFDENQYRTNDRPYRIEASPKPAIGKETGRTTENNLATVLQDLSIPKVEEMVGAMMPPLTGTNYRITVKMSPKNKTNTNAGFKEVHTSVNKSYDDNGLRYYTLLNVSQISKIEKLNKTDEARKLMEPLSDHLINQQEQIKALLKLHKKRVDLQLNNLLRESKHLEKMIKSNKDYNIDKTITLLKDDDNGMGTANEEKFLDSVRKMQRIYSTESKNLTTTPSTSKSITVLPSITETAIIDKSKIIDTIKQNENVTYEILKKIDTNTQILQNFLQKISGKLEFDKKEHTNFKTTEKSALEMKFDLSKDWKSYGVNKDVYFIPNELKNNTIPFVYAYQQSIPMKNKSPSESLASLVYHGHIHTNAVQNNMNNNNLEKPTPKVEPNILLNTDHGKRKFNESKFFVDGINNYFNVSPSKDRVISANININTTNSV